MFPGFRYWAAWVGLILLTSSANVRWQTVDNLTGGDPMGDGKAKIVIKRVYVPTQVRDLPNGEKLKIPGHYKAPPTDANSAMDE
jgi:hypothetical protein